MHEVGEVLLDNQGERSTYSARARTIVDNRDDRPLKETSPWPSNRDVEAGPASPKPVAAPSSPSVRAGGTRLHEGRFGFRRVGRHAVY